MVCVGFAGLLFTSGALLFYTAMVAPVQIFLWDYADPCNKFPSLYFDVVVDIFFMVRIQGTAGLYFCPNKSVIVLSGL